MSFILRTMLLLVVIKLYFTEVTFAQSGKPAIDFAAIDDWSWMPTGKVSISDDGRYWSYMIGTLGGGDVRTIIGSTTGETLYELSGNKPGMFSGNSRWYIYHFHDSLFFLPLVGDQSRLVAGVTGFQVNEGPKRGSAKVQWLAYQLNDSSRTLVLHHLYTGREEHIDGVKSYSFEVSGRWIVCRLNGGGLLLQPLGTGKPVRLNSIGQYLLDRSGRILFTAISGAAGLRIERRIISENKSTVLWERSSEKQSVSSLSTDARGSRLLFTVKGQQGSSQSTAIWYWGAGQQRAEERLRDGAEDIEAGLVIDGASLSDDGRYIMINLKANPVTLPKPKADAVQIDIWHYRDTVIQSEQLMYGKTGDSNPWLDPASYKAVLPVTSSRLLQLESRYKRSVMMAGDWSVVKRNDLIDFDLKSVREDVPDSVWLVSLQDGSWRLWHKGNERVASSAGRRYLLWFDRDIGHYFTRDLLTGREVNISTEVPVFLGTEMAVDYEVKPDNGRTGVVGWLPEDKWVLLYDSYDIWLLDPAGGKAPVCITNGYGRRNGIKLRLTVGKYNSIGNRQPIALDAELLLTAFDTRTMENGFYRTSLKSQSDPKKLFMGSYMMDLSKNLIPNNGDLPGGLMPPVKARDEDAWIVSRQSAEEAPNYYVTSDFKTYRPLTQNHPQRKYNWLTTKLVPFRQMDGSMSQGILYMPENFDSTKKYPLIIRYYFQFSHLRNAYNVPQYMDNAYLDVPWLVSHGYLVFAPDIYFKNDRPRPVSAWNTVEGAGLHLRRLPYVDSTKMGISGHSRAGGYTNYIITHSSQFAAAIEGAGVSNWVSAQHTLIYTNGRIRSTIGQEPYIYTNKEFMLDNPILNADKVKCPLLIFHNKLDEAVPWEQGVELYIALRRLGKPVWMLQYDGEGHALSKKKNKKDFTLRVTQYLDHYLKGEFPPRWMTMGIPARLKGMDSGLEPARSNFKQ